MFSKDGLLIQSNKDGSLDLVIVIGGLPVLTESFSADEVKAARKVFDQKLADSATRKFPGLSSTYPRQSPIPPGFDPELGDWDRSYRRKSPIGFDTESQKQN